MNLIFWLLVGAMLLLALLIVLPPLWREFKSTVPDDLDQRNIKIAKDRLAELKANRDAGGISQVQYDEQVTELEIALSDDLDIATQPVKTSNQGRWLVYVLLVLIPSLSAGLYWQLGTFEAVSHSDELNQAGSETPSPEAIKKMVVKLAEKLKAEPNNAEGWLMLGRSYKVLQQYSDAIDAFSHAYNLSGENPDVMLPYAELLAFTNNNQWTGKPEELVAKALAIEPENLTALWFAAIAKAQQNDKKTAVGYLHKLEGLMPADAPDKQQLHELIVNTEKELGTTSEPATTQQNAASSVDIQVSLAPELQKAVSPQDTVFVYAQALSGPKMPLAIIRKQVSDLPLSVTLTDAQAMMPAMKLSNFKEVRLLARISKSGSAMPQPEDLIGTVEQANLSEKQVHKIVINKQMN